MKRRVLNFGLLAVFIFFVFLLLKITLQYIPFHPDVAFLRIKQQYIDVPYYLTMFYVHVYSAIFCMIAGFTQFSKRFRQRKWKYIHKYSGLFYVLVVLLLAAPSGLYIGIYANGGLSSRIAFVLLALSWFFFTAIAMWKIRQKDYASHRYFMIRSWSLALSAITLRAWKYLIVALFHPRPMDVYQLVAWLGWGLNLFIAELIILRIKKSKQDHL